MEDGVLGEPGASVRGHVVRAFRPIAEDVTTQGRKQCSFSELPIVSGLPKVIGYCCTWEFQCFSISFSAQKMAEDIVKDRENNTDCVAKRFALHAKI